MVISLKEVKKDQQEKKADKVCQKEWEQDKVSLEKKKKKLIRLREENMQD